MKKLIILLLLFPSIALAQTPTARDAFYTITDFSDLLNSHVSPYLMNKGMAVEARNVRANDQYGALSKRNVMIEYGSCSSAAVEGLHRYYKSDGTKSLIIGSGANLYRGDDTGNSSCTTLGTGFTDGARWECITYKDNAICINGNEQPVKYDGATAEGTADGDRTANYQVAELGAPFAELNTGSNLDASSWYQYKIQCTDGSVTWYSDALSNAIQTGATVRDIRLTDIPLCPTGTTSRSIYRTEGQASAAALSGATFKLVDSISDNTTRTYNDTTTDGGLGDVWSTSGAVDLTPPIGKHILIHKDFVFIANESSTTYGKSTLFWSKVLNPDIFDTSSDYELIRPDDGDEIQGIRNQLGILVILKENTIQKFFTDSANDTNWEISAPFSHVGAIAAYSIDNSPLGIFFLGEDGIYIFNGQSAQLISDKVTDVIEDISPAYLDDAVGAFYKNIYHLAYTSESAGGGANNRVLVYENTRDSYSIDYKNLSSFAKFNSGDDFNVLYAGSSGTDGKVYAFEEAPNNLIWRTKSELEEATEDSITYAGTEESPSFSIGWGVTIDDSSLAGETIDGYTPTTAIIDRPKTTGIWYGNSIRANADSLDRLFWNEELNSGNDITFSIRTAATEAGLAGESWSGSYTDPTGSDISGVTGNTWLQLRGTLTTDEITETPELFLDDNYVIKLIYNIAGSTKESSVLTLYKTGFNGLQIGQSDIRYSPKRIKEIWVYYEGDAGELDFVINNLQEQIGSFSIDLSVSPSDNDGDDYFGNTNEKVFRYIPNATGTQITGRQFQFQISEDSANTWKINQIMFRFDVFDYRTLK